MPDFIENTRTIIEAVDDSASYSLDNWNEHNFIVSSDLLFDVIKALKENDIILALGPAGTGKSFLAVSVAITLLMEKKMISKLNAH